MSPRCSARHEAEAEAETRGDGRSGLRGGRDGCTDIPWHLGRTSHQGRRFRGVGSMAGKERSGGPVSRILSPPNRRRAIIHLGRRLLDGSSALPAARTMRAASCSPEGEACRLHGLAGGGVYPAADVTTRAVRSYRTIAPLPVPAGADHRRCRFCGTFPELPRRAKRRVARSALPTTVPCPVRTFLPARAGADGSIARPTGLFI